MAWHAYLGAFGAETQSWTKPQRCTLRPRRLHVGQEPDPATGAVVTPIYQVSTFRLPAPDEADEYVYARVPTQR